MFGGRRVLAPASFGIDVAEIEYDFVRMRPAANFIGQFVSTYDGQRPIGSVVNYRLTFLYLLNPLDSGETISFEPLKVREQV